MTGDAVQRAATETFRGLQARVHRDAAVVALLVLALAATSFSVELPERLSGHPWRGTVRYLTGHLLTIVAGAHLVMIWFGNRRARDLKRAVRRSEQLALHDPLTGLPNRALFFDRLEQELARSRREQQLVAVVMFDLDSFKMVNDRYGHLAGDELLRQVASRMAAASRETDTVARIGGDEFVVLVTGAGGLTAVERAASRLHATFHEPFSVDGKSLKIAASAGVAVARDEDRRPDDLLHRADKAMYAAKRSGGGIRGLCLGHPPDASNEGG